MIIAVYLRRTSTCLAALGLAMLGLALLGLTGTASAAPTFTSLK